MTSVLPIFLATGDKSILDVLVWIVAVVAWIVAQISAARKAQEKRRQQQSRLASAPPPPAATAGGIMPTADELSEIFKRLGADIPGTPPPAPRPPPAPGLRLVATKPVSPRPVSRKIIQRVPLRKAVAPVDPALAERLARVQQEADEAARRADAEAQTVIVAGHGVEVQRGDSRVVNTATRHSKVILPRIHAMELRLSAWPLLPMPGFDRSHHATRPLRARLHVRTEIRDAWVAQTFLRPPKSIVP